MNSADANTTKPTRIKLSKVCLITSIHPAFDTRIFHKEAVSLAAAGYETTLIAPHPVDETVSGVHIKAFPRTGSRLSRFFSLWRPLRIALKESADVYHFHDPDLLVVGILLKLFTNAKVIYDVHEDVPKDILSKTWIPRPLRSPIALVAKAMESTGARSFDNIIAATSAIGKRFPADKTSLVENMPMLDEFDLLVERPYGARLPIVCYIGSITRIRGAMEMIKAINFVSQKTNVKFLVAGDCCPLELKEEMQACADGVSVEFFGRVDRKKVGDILGQSRVGLVLLHPEQNHLEAQPNKLFEYMSAGIPVVASDFPLWREIVGGNGCGLLVDPLNPGMIGEAIQQLLEDSDEAKAMGERGRKAVVSKYNWSNEAKKLLAVYERLSG